MTVTLAFIFLFVRKQERWCTCQLGASVSDAHIKHNLMLKKLLSMVPFSNNCNILSHPISKEWDFLKFMTLQDFPKSTDSFWGLPMTGLLQGPANRPLCSFRSFKSFKLFKRSFKSFTSFKSKFQEFQEFQEFQQFQEQFQAFQELQEHVSRARRHDFQNCLKAQQARRHGFKSFKRFKSSFKSFMSFKSKFHEFQEFQEFQEQFQAFQEFQELGNKTRLNGRLPDLAAEKKTVSNRDQVRFRRNDEDLATDRRFCDVSKIFLSIEASPWLLDFLNSCSSEDKLNNMLLHWGK